MLVVSHVPRSAGNSFKRILRGYFGDRLLSVSAEAHRMPQPSTSIPKRFYSEDIECIFGHLAPAVFKKEEYDIKFMTWIRNPIDRLISHFCLLPEVYNSAGALQQRVVDENWSLERFCLSPEFRNLYSKYYNGFGIENFNFVGVVEHFKEDLDWVSKNYFGGELSYLHVSKRGYSIYPED